MIDKHCVFKVGILLTTSIAWIRFCIMDQLYIPTALWMVWRNVCCKRKQFKGSGVLSSSKKLYLVLHTSLIQFEFVKLFISNPKTTTTFIQWVFHWRYESCNLVVNEVGPAYVNVLVIWDESGLQHLKWSQTCMLSMSCSSHWKVMTQEGRYLAGLCPGASSCICGRVGLGGLGWAGEEQ